MKKIFFDHTESKAITYLENTRISLIGSPSLYQIARINPSGTRYIIDQKEKQPATRAFQAFPKPESQKSSKIPNFSKCKKI